MRVITLVKMLWTPQQILTTVMKRLVVDKSTDHAKPHFDLFLPQYQRQRICFFSERELKKALRDTLQRQISQSDCEISSNFGFKKNEL